MTAVGFSALTRQRPELAFQIQISPLHTGYLAAPLASYQEQLKQRAKQRVNQLQAAGRDEARLYGADEELLGGLNSFYLLLDEPEVYGLPSSAKVPSRSVASSSMWSIITAILTALGIVFAFRERTASGGGLSTENTK